MLLSLQTATSTDHSITRQGVAGRSPDRGRPASTLGQTRPAEQRCWSVPEPLVPVHLATSDLEDGLRAYASAAQAYYGYYELPAVMYI